MSPLFSSHLEDSSAPIISAEITPHCFKAIHLPFHPLCTQKKKGQMLFTLSDLAVIYVYPVLYTASSQSPSCHHSKQVFSSAMQMRKTEMTRTASGSSGARQLNMAHFRAYRKTKAPSRVSGPLGLCDIHCATSRGQRWDSIAKPPLKPHPTLPPMVLCSARYSCTLVIQDLGEVVEHAFKQQAKHGL